MCVFFVVSGFIFRIYRNEPETKGWCSQPLLHIILKTESKVAYRNDNNDVGWLWAWRPRDASESGWWRLAGKKPNNERLRIYISRRAEQVSSFREAAQPPAQPSASSRFRAAAAKEITPSSLAEKELLLLQGARAHKGSDKKHERLDTARPTHNTLFNTKSVHGKI